jgi:hypothetical protein
MTTQFLKIRQIGDMLLHSKVIRIIDGGLSPKSSAFLKVLLDVRLLELNVNAGVYPVGDDTGSELGGCSFGNLPLEEELHPIRTAKIDIFPDHFLEELTTSNRTIKNLGEACFNLPDTKPVEIAAQSILGIQRKGKKLHPLIEEPHDMLWSKKITDLLQPLGEGARKKPIVQALIAHSLFFQLTLHPLMTIEANANGEGHIGADLDECRSKLPILDVEVIVVHKDRLARVVKAHPARLRLFQSLEGGGFLLSHPDKDHAFFLAKLGAILGCYVVLSLSLLEMDNRNVVLISIALDGLHKTLGHLAKKGW